MIDKKVTRKISVAFRAAKVAKTHTRYFRGAKGDYENRTLLCQNFLHYTSMYIGQPIIAAGVMECQFFVIDTQQV